MKVKEFKEYLNTLPDDTDIMCCQIDATETRIHFKNVDLKVETCCEFYPKNENIVDDFNLLRIGKYIQ